MKWKAFELRVKDPWGVVVEQYGTREELLQGIRECLLSGATVRGIWFNGRLCTRNEHRDFARAAMAEWDP